MSRKTTAAAKLPSAPKTVGERRRELRAAKTAETKPGVRKVEIDLAKPEARKALTSLYPRPLDDVILEATPDLEAAALDYIKARDEATLAEDRKEAAGNVLCNAIRTHLGAAGDGWKAEWALVKGSVDWTALAKELAIPDDVIAKHRRDERRSLTVREIADEG